jgi:spore maturation protein CgeB
MKIMIVGSFWEYSLEESYARAFRKLGHAVVSFDFDKRYAAEPLSTTRVGERLGRGLIGNKVGKMLIEAVAHTQPDLVIVVKGKLIPAGVLQKVKTVLGDRPLVNFNPDSPWEARNTSRALISSLPIYDHHFTWSRELQKRFVAAGFSQASYLPFAYDAEIHSPIENLSARASTAQLPEYDTVFIGTYDPTRDQLLSELSEFRIAIWGNDWERAKHVPKSWLHGKAVYGRESVALLDLGVCALNLLRPQNEASHNMRTFEIPATAHLMIANRTAEHREFFVEGEEVEYFATVSELKEKLQRLRADSEYVQRAAQKAFERVKEETYEKRARTILTALGLS